MVAVTLHTNKYTELQYSLLALKGCCGLYLPHKHIFIGFAGCFFSPKLQLLKPYIFCRHVNYFHKQISMWLQSIWSKEYAEQLHIMCSGCRRVPQHNLQILKNTFAV